MAITIGVSIDPRFVAKAGALSIPIGIIGPQDGFIKYSSQDQSHYSKIGPENGVTRDLDCHYYGGMNKLH
jgi:hypothetical protein